MGTDVIDFFKQYNTTYETACREKKVEYLKDASKYKYVYAIKFKGEVIYRSYITRLKWANYFLTEREAAIAVDKKLIEKGKEPVNILKKCLK